MEKRFLQIKSESIKMRHSQKFKIVLHPQFWSDQVDFPATLSTYEMVTLTEIHMNWPKIMDVTLFLVSDIVSFFMIQTLPL